MPKQIHLWAFLQGIGHYPSGWRHADARPQDVFSMDYYRHVGQMIERGRFDAIVFGDQLQSRGAGGRAPERLAMPTLDPMSLLCAIASVTEHVGLVATISTTYNTPDGPGGLHPWVRLIVWLVLILVWVVASVVLLRSPSPGADGGATE